MILLTVIHGQMIEEYVYDAFGNNFEGTFLKRNEIGYNGKIFDPAVRLYDYGYRDYAPIINRWITVYPVRDGMNWFIYCHNDPINLIDFIGLLDTQPLPLPQQTPMPINPQTNNTPVPVQTP